MEKSREIVNKYWGFSFRPLQEEIADSAIYGHDTLAILPTGGGKSICFQVPGIAREGVCIVISPLIALMQDQVKNLEKRGIKAVMLSSSMSYREIDIELDNARFGKTKFIYLSPERLRSTLFIERFKRMTIALIVIDEAHCISEWGNDFRPSYFQIAELRTYHPNVPFLALTASATPEVREEICRKLEMKQTQIFEGSIYRPNISYKVNLVPNKLQEIIQYCYSKSGFCGIVYCQTRKSVKDIAVQLRAAGVKAGIYHGGMNADDRSLMLKAWMDNSIHVMVATNAFGMGIDKPDVRFVLHYEFPNNLEAYYQEAGRAGRDGAESDAVVFYEAMDLQQHEELLERKYPESELIKRIYDAICNYLKIAFGSGRDENYPFDLNDFCKKFNFKPGDVYSSLKILSANGSIDFEEQSFLPTRVKFNIGQSALYHFQVGHPELNDTILALLRSYPGIFDGFVRIDEKKISQIAKISSEQLRTKLNSIAQYGVLDVHLQSNSPQLYFLEERKPSEHIKLAPEVYINRKQKDHYRLQQVADYLESKNCRSELLAVYFGSTAKKCGKCDNCNRSEALLLSDSQLLEQLLHLLPQNREDLKNQFGINYDRIVEMTRTLLLEEKIILKDGKYFNA
jgi:ATP-dependent DNA helicase RecQ